MVSLSLVTMPSLYCCPKGFRLSLPEKKKNNNNNNADAHEILVAANNYINQRFLKRFEFQVLKLSMADTLYTYTHTRDIHVYVCMFSLLSRVPSKLLLMRRLRAQVVGFLTLIVPDYVCTCVCVCVCYMDRKKGIRY